MGPGGSRRSPSQARQHQGRGDRLVPGPQEAKQPAGPLMSPALLGGVPSRGTPHRVPLHMKMGRAFGEHTAPTTVHPVLGASRPRRQSQVQRASCLPSDPTRTVRGPGTETRRVHPHVPPRDLVSRAGRGGCRGGKQVGSSRGRGQAGAGHCAPLPSGSPPPLRPSPPRICL